MIDNFTCVVYARLFERIVFTVSRECILKYTYQSCFAQNHSSLFLRARVLVKLAIYAVKFAMKWSKLTVKIDYLNVEIVTICVGGEPLYVGEIFFCSLKLFKKIRSCIFNLFA